MDWWLTTGGLVVDNCMVHWWLITGGLVVDNWCIGG